MTKANIAYLLLFLILMSKGFAEENKLKPSEFNFDGAKYSIVYSWEGRMKSDWDYLKNNLPPITFKEAKGLLQKEIERAFPEEVFQISELNLNTNSAGYSYYHARLTHLIEGIGYSYTHLNLEVYMDGSVSKIRLVDPVDSGQ